VTGVRLRARPVGASALLVEVDGAADVRILSQEIERRRAAGALGTVVDVVPGARTVLLDGVTDPAALARTMLAWELGADRSESGDPSAAAPVPRSIDVPAAYDGPDLEGVAARWGVGVDEAVRLHARVQFVVAFCGFSPGFAYLTGMPDHLAVPRRATPRDLVPAGAIGLAGAYCGVYPRASPGGWQLIARTDLQLWDPGRTEPALLTPGTGVRFVPS